MPLPIPQLDDIDFNQLIETARALIPRYAPQWTDHNIHDPGVTLLDLISWLVDQQIYQAGYVGDQHIESFAALLGVRPALSKPATGLVWPDESAPTPIGANGVNLNKGNKATCVEQPEIPYELTHDVYLTPARIADRDMKDSASRFQLTARMNQRSVLPIQEATRQPNSIELLFDRPLVEETPDQIPVFPLSIGAQLEKESLCEHSDARYGRLVVDYRVDEASDSPWRRLDIFHDGTGSFSRSGIILLDIPAYKNHQTQSPQSRLRFRVQHRASPLPIKIVRLAVNVLPIKQWLSVGEQVLGVSKGHPDQIVPIANLDTTQDSIGLSNLDDVIIRTKENGQWLNWERVDDITEELPQRNVFELHHEENVIKFGNGINGRIPPRDTQIIRDPLKLTLGSQGNLRTELNWVVQGVAVTLGGSFGRNIAVIGGGMDAQNIDDLRARARQNALKREVLLTNEELEEAAKQLEGLDIARAEVKVDFHPAMPKRQLPGIRTLVVTPKRIRTADPLEPVKPAYLRAVHSALISRRVIGERLIVIGSKRISVSVLATINIEDGIDPEIVKESALTVLNARLSDISVSESISPWPVGRAVHNYEIKTLLAGINGVVAIPECLLAEGKNNPQQIIELQPDAIAIGRDHRLMINTLREKR